MKISQFGTSPPRGNVRGAKPATVPLEYRLVADLGGFPEAHSLDGRMWSVITPEGGRKVLLFEEDTGVILDELAVRLAWYGTEEYRCWGRGVDWLLFSNEVITHDGEVLIRHQLQEEYPLDEYRYVSPTDGDAIDGETGLYNQIIARFGWEATHLNPFPWRGEDYVPPPCLRLLKSGNGTPFLGRWLLHGGEVYHVAGRTLSTRYPQSSSWVLAHENSFLPEECELSVIGGKLYGSAYRWIGRAYLYPRDFRRDGTAVSTYYLLVTNSEGVNYGDMETTIGTELGKAVIAAEGIAYKRGEESLSSGPWRTSNGADVVFAGHQVSLEDGIISTAVGGGTVRVGDTVLTELDAGGETLKALGGFKYWLNPAGTGGGMLAGLAVGTSRDMTIYTDTEKFNRFTVPVNRGGTVLPRQVGEHMIQDSFCSTNDKLFRSRVTRKGTVTPDLTPDWGEIIKAPVSISMPLTMEGMQWDMADAPLLFQTYRASTPLGHYEYLPSDPSAVSLKWITNTGGLMDDTYVLPSLASNEKVRFPWCVDGEVYAILFQDDEPVAGQKIDIPAECAGMWTRPFATWDCKAPESVGIHCNFRYTQTIDFIHAPAAMYKENSLAGGRVGYLTFYHGTTSQIYTLYDPFFVSMVEDMEPSPPTAQNPSPGLYIPNGGGWLKEYGADPFTDAFGKTRYRQNVAVIVTWDGRNVDSGGYRQWTKHRLAVMKMSLDTDELDLAAVAAQGRINA